MLRAELQHNDLKHAWDRVSGIPHRSSPNDAFTLVLLTGYAGGVSITAQNGHVYGVSRCPGIVEQGLEPFIVQAEQMSRLVANADGLVTFRRNGIQMDVSCPGWRVTLPSVSGQFFRPELHEACDKYATRAEQLLFGLESALAATGKSHKSFSVELATLDFRKPNEPVAFGLDGTNASIYRLPVIEENTVGGIAKLPQQGIKQLLSFFRHEEGLVRLTHDVNWLVAYNNECALYARMAEGKLPDWSKIVDSNPHGELMRVTRQELSTAIRAATVAVDPNSPDEGTITVRCDVGTMTLTAQSSQYGSSEATVPYTGGNPSPVQFMVQANRFAKAVSRFADPEIEMGPAEHQGGIIFKAGDLTWILGTVVRGED